MEYRRSIIERGAVGTPALISAVYAFRLDGERLRRHKLDRTGNRGDAPIKV